MKDAARLLAYLTGTLLFAALAAPLLYWSAQFAASHGVFASLRDFEFETFFHRALLLGALCFFWPLLRSLKIRSWRELGLTSNKHILRDGATGFTIAAVPLLLFGAVLIALHIYNVRPAISLAALAQRSLSALVVPFIEEPFFRGLILGVLLRSASPWLAISVTSGFFSILHFLKPGEPTSAVVGWTSGFASITNAFAQFQEPMLVAAGFSTLFLLGWILADARVRTRSLWLPIGLHAGWIFSSALFSKIARQQIVLLPWLGRNLLIGLAPLCLALLSWGIMRIWLQRCESRNQ